MCVRDEKLTCSRALRFSTRENLILKIFSRHLLKRKRLALMQKGVFPVGKLTCQERKFFSLCFQEFQVVLFVRKLNYINKGHNYHQGTIIITEKGK